MTGLSDLQAPQIAPPLDDSFRPAVLQTRPSTGESSIHIALERSPDSISRASISTSHPFLLERWLKFLLWSRGAHRIHFAGPKELADKLREHYLATPTGKF